MLSGPAGVPQEDSRWRGLGTGGNSSAKMSEGFDKRQPRKSPHGPPKALRCGPMPRRPPLSFSSSLWSILAIVGLAIGCVAFGFGWGLITMAIGGVIGKLIEYRLQADRGSGPSGFHSAF